MKKTDNYFRKGIIERVVDGDTVIVHVDLGFSVWTKQRFRLYGIQAPETKTPEGKVSKDFLTGYLMVCVDGVPVSGVPVIVETIRAPGGKLAKTFDRYVAVLYVVAANGNTINVNKLIVRKGYAKKWDKFKRFRKK